MTRGVRLANAIYLLVMEVLYRYAHKDQLTPDELARTTVRVDAHRETIARLVDEVAP